MSDKKNIVLLIEDDEVDREAVSRLLNETYQLHTAATGQEGVALADDITPDVVLLDYRLPDVEGLKLLATFVEQDIPVILLTVEESPEIIVEVMRNGAYDYMVKRQMSQAALSRAIYNAIEHTNLRRDLEREKQVVAEQAELLAEQSQKILELASALSLAEQEERQRVAHILHDEVQQIIHGIQVRTHLLGGELSSPQRMAVQSHLDDLNSLTDQALKAVRTLSVDLNPPLSQGDGLDVALEWLAEQMNRRHKFTVDLEVDVECCMEDDHLRMLVFQITRELLFNVIKHAGVDKARLECHEENSTLIIKVVDEGCGFDVEALALHSSKSKGGIGLFSIRERLKLFKGNLEITSTPNEGTTAIVTVPDVVKIKPEDILADSQ